MIRHSAAALLALGGLAGAATAQTPETAPTAAAAPGAPSGPWRTGVTVGAAHMFDAGLDGGGDFSATRWYAQATLSYAFDPRTSIGLTVGGGVEDYDFSGVGAPWDQINELRVGVPVRFSPHDRVDVFAIASLRWHAEDGGSLDDGRTEGLIAGATYAVSDRLRIGPGLGVFSQIEDDVSVFPILLIDWRITDRLALRTGAGFAATQGPGLTLDWQATDTLSLGLGARSEDSRFRLDDSGPAPGGVGEETGFPIYATATWRPLPYASLVAVAGAKVAGSLRLENANGQTQAKDDYDAAPFVGIAGSLRF